MPVVASWRTVTEDYEQHLSRLRNAYGAKAQATLDALARHMPQGVTWSKPQGGMFVWLRLPEGIDGKELLARAIAEERVAFVPGAPGELPKPAALKGQDLGLRVPADTPTEVISGPRIGISKAIDLPWRFGLAGSKHLSRRF